MMPIGSKHIRRAAMGMAVALVALVAAAAIAQVAPHEPGAEIRAAMAWAFPQNPPANSQAATPDDKTPLHLLGSPRAYTRAQIGNMFGAPDWWPQDHPPMPRIVAHGRGQAWACAYCHLPNGQGRPENAALAGLPAVYIIEQVKAFRSGERASTQSTAKFMRAEARNVDDADLKVAADYFSKLKFKPWTRVIETTTVPKTRIEHWMLMPHPGAGSEPIGARIIETSTDPQRTEWRDARSGFVAYVPMVSIARGQILATRGQGVVQPCVACHGADLRGAGNIPPLAGRSPTYIVRQLIQFRNGGRRGPATLPMQQEASRLTLNDMIAVAAYAASRRP